MPNLWFYGILNFLKKGCGSSDLREIRAIVRKLHKNIWYRSRNFGIEFGQNRLKRSNFFRFWTFWKISTNCLTQANFLLLSSNSVSKWSNTKWIKFQENRSGALKFRKIWSYFTTKYFDKANHRLCKNWYIHKASTGFYFPFSM